MNLTLFLGAGFSAPFGHPVMNTFLGFADGCPRLNEDDRAFLGKLVLEARRANSFLESSPTNLEDILSFSEMGERLRLIQDGQESPSDRLRSIMQKIYTHTPPAKEYWPRYQSLENLLGAKPREFKGSLSFVTTNYDLNIESACVSLDAQLDPSFRIVRTKAERVQVIAQCYAEGAIPLYKLHGSVNWFLSAEEAGLVVEDRVVALFNPFENRQSSIPYPCAGDYKAPCAPVIVPPSFLKPELPDALKVVWRGAAKTLSAANMLAFVGYSFPPSDTEMMYFLARALMDNPTLRVVYVVDPSADRIVSRLKGAGSKMGSHFRDLLHPINGDWTTVSLPL